MILKSIFHTIICAILVSVLFCGCLNWPGAKHRLPPSSTLSTDQAQQANTFFVYFYREASYKGLGRVHLLKIGDEQVGTMEADNYIRIELWPGEYHLAVYQPVENFLGNTIPATNTSIKLVIQPTSVPGTAIYQYTDGSGIHRVEPADKNTFARLTEQRVLTTSLSARETAQVHSLYNARYDGPTKSGKPNGMGSITWDDGSTFKGRFEYGEVTTEGLFFFPDGHIYMGPTGKGRPIGPGVLMTHERQILYAGRFLNERPHGRGIRSGEDGPEFCEYDAGKDITKTIHQQVLDALETEDQAFSIVDLGNPDFIDWYLKPPSIQSILGDQFFFDPFNNHEVQDQTTPSHDDRVRIKQNEIELGLRQRLEEKREWCIKEFLLGRSLCVCTPFAEDFDRWNGCESR